MTDLDLIKSKLDIVELIGSYVPEVQRAGANFRARCPFHTEKTPSFMINPSLQIFKCFGCGKAGDAIKFIEEIERVDFQEALKIAAQKAGIELTGNYAHKDKKLDEEKKRITDANLLTSKFYNYILKTHKLGTEGRNYALKRKIDGKRIEDFLIGFAPGSTNALKNFLLSKGFNDKELVKFGLLVERNDTTVDKFRNRLLQPIFNVQGDVIGFSGRYVGTSKLPPKYLNSPETIIYKKNEILYGLYQAKEAMRKSNYVILVEGNIDIISSHRVGVENIVAPLGTAFTPNQAKLIKRFSSEIYFSFDTDAAGTKALVRGIEIAEQIGLKHKVINLTGFQDADELIVKQPDEWQKRIDSANDSVEYLIKKFAEDLDLGTAEGKSKFRDRILPIVNSIKDEVTLAHYVKEVSVILEVTSDVLLKKITAKETKSQTDEEIKTQNPNSKKNQFELYFLAFLINSLDNSVLEDIPEEIFSNDIFKEIFKIFKQSKDNTDLGRIAESINESLKSQFEELTLLDLPQGKDAKVEFNKVYYSLMKKYYDNQVKKLRVELAKDEENDDLVKQLNETAKLMKILEQRKEKDIFIASHNTAVDSLKQ